MYMFAMAECRKCRAKGDTVYTELGVESIDTGVVCVCLCARASTREDVDFNNIGGRISNVAENFQTDSHGVSGTFIIKGGLRRK